jgi:hypothetical protein
MMCAILLRLLSDHVQELWSVEYESFTPLFLRSMLCSLFSLYSHMGYRRMYSVSAIVASSILLSSYVFIFPNNIRYYTCASA